MQLSRRTTTPIAALVSLLMGAVLLAVVAGPADADRGTRDTSPVQLRTNDLRSPMGIDDLQPDLSWHLDGARKQLAYQVRAATTEHGLGRADLWDSGRVSSAQSVHVPWAGKKLTSRMRVHWQVRVWDGHGQVSDWSRTSRFEMGLLHPDDWSADWIGNPDWLHRKPTPAVVDVPAQDARYVEVTTTQLGLPLEESGHVYHRLQLAEIVVRDAAKPGDDLARDAAVTSTDPKTYPGKWEPRFLTDGQLDSNKAPFGYSSAAHASAKLDDPITLTIDLGSVRHFDQLVLYPRTDAATDEGRSPNFPRDFTVSTAGADQVFTTVHSVTDQEEPPAYNADFPAWPLFAKQFDLDKPVRSARLYTTGLGIYDAKLNGKAVSRAVLQPGNTDYHDRISYSVNDVTGLLRRGDNALSVRLGAGTSVVPRMPGRYTKWTGILTPPKLIAQLEVTYTDGTTERIDSDDSWRTTLGPTVFSHWYGGEDYDARRSQPGWDRPGADLTRWDSAEPTGPPTPTTQLTAQQSPPIEPVDRLHTVKITEPEPGTYVFDVGTNIAGWPVLHVGGAAGTTLTLKPGERLGQDGTVDQSTMLGGGKLYPPLVDHYTMGGQGRETWHPDFSYHGFRYLQVTGLTERPSKDMVEAIVLRAANEESGSFESSSALLNSIHRLVNRSVQGNMYSILTDCPDREKLGWLEETHLVFGTIARNYDVAAYYRDQVRTMAEAQQPDGSVPAIAPLYYQVFGGAADNRNEPNWGSAIVMAPWQMYQTYGDTETLRTFYPNMQRYLDYLTGRSSGHLLDYGLGDWGGLDKTTPKGITATFGYYRATEAMSRIADALGRSADAAGYRELARQIAAAFNAKYLDPEKHTYGSGSQGSDALALDMGVVPADQHDQVVAHLVKSVESEGDYFTVGEVPLPSLLRVLTAAHREDLILAAVTETKRPGYGYSVVHGATALPEYWDGATGYGSQDHFMMGAIDEWFSASLAGIGQQPDSVGFKKLLIAPAVVGDLTRAQATYRTPYGKVASSWQRSGRSFRLDVTVPANTTARVEVPTWPGQGPATGNHGARAVGSTDRATVFEVGPGSWKFVSHTPERVPDHRVQLDIQAPAADIAVVSGQPVRARFVVHNLMDHAVRVRPEATVTRGFSVETPDRMTLPAHSSVDLDLAIQRTGEDATEGSIRVTAGDASATASLETTDDLARIATMSASSIHGGWSAAAANDGSVEGQTDYDTWNSGGGWNDNTSGEFPDWLQARWTDPLTIDRVVMRTVGSTKAPAAKYGPRDYQVQGLVDGAWQTLDTVQGNTEATVTSTFDPVELSALRLLVGDTNDHSYSRVVELEAYDDVD